MAGAGASGVSAPDPAIIVREWTWKTEAMREAMRAVLECGLSGDGVATFSALDVPLRGASAQGGTGILGSVFRQLADLGILAPVGAFAGGQFCQFRVRNARGNPVGVWRLGNRGLAEALLMRCGGRPLRYVDVPLFQEKTA